ncbi:uncharacterized protein LOC133308277 [Gastrolobium bilobum]|uniref:uncharacterized protein LOC133308277 n=1 Tax=Gastrolobium bilobum TaxID=150636 RepID=UPI002AB1DCC1|nr:uncharacterized protein LOC133308277 [Gastrolobium bilobum]
MLRSQDYHAHISKVHRTPSVLPDVPRYPNAHQVFTKKVNSEEDKGFNGGHHNPQTRERLAVVEEYEQTTVPENGVAEVIYEENVDAETNQDYPRKNKGGFELQKWKTFRL